MKATRKILLYDDNPEYGGHQVMAAFGLEALLASGEFDVTFWYDTSNSKWNRRIGPLIDSKQLNTGECATRTGKLQLLRNRWQRSMTLRQKLTDLNPDLVLFIQGDIEHSSLALLEAVRLGLPVASYIPMCHSYKVMQAKLAGFRDALARNVYRSVSNWITISKSISEDLLVLSPGSRVLVVENGIPISRFAGCADGPMRPDLRKELGLSEHERTIAIVGRVEFNQKCQDLALRAFEDQPAAFSGWNLLFVGSGPDENRLDRMIAESPGNSRVKRIAWLDNPERIYSAIDCLLIPSRYEGVPLVMLEALASGVPVIGSDRDGMKDMLPDNWRFASGSITDLADTFLKAVSTGFQELDFVRKKVLLKNDLASFKTSFVEAVRQLVP